MFRNGDKLKVEDKLKVGDKLKVEDKEEKLTTATRFLLSIQTHSWS